MYSGTVFSVRSVPIVLSFSVIAQSAPSTSTHGSDLVLQFWVLIDLERERASDRFQMMQNRTLLWTGSISRLRRGAGFKSNHLPLLMNELHELVQSRVTQSASSPEKTRRFQKILFGRIILTKDCNCPNFFLGKILSFGTSFRPISRHSDIVFDNSASRKMPGRQKYLEGLRAICWREETFRRIVIARNFYLDWNWVLVLLPHRFWASQVLVAIRIIQSSTIGRPKEILWLRFKRSETLDPIVFFSLLM